MLKHKISATILGVLLVAISFGQGVVYNYTLINELVGLPGPSVRSVFEDGRGYIWVGIEGEGVFMYDGQAFTPYADSAGVTRLTGTSVEAMEEDENGNFWIATTNGLNYFNPEKNSVVRYLASKTDSNTIASNYCSMLRLRNGNEVWVATEKGASCLNTETNEVYNYLDQLDDSLSTVYDISLDKDNKVWFATAGGIYSCSDRNKGLEKADLGNSFSNFRLVRCDKNGRYWAINRDSIFTSLNGKKWNSIKEHELTSFAGSIAMTFDANGDIWLYSENKGISIIDINSFERKPFFSRASLKGLDVRSMLTDSRGNVWLATKFKGAFVFNPAASVFPLYGYGENKQTSITDKHVLAITEDQNGKVLVGTKRGGLYEFDLQTKLLNQLLIGDKLEPKSKISSIIVTDDNLIWCMISHKVYRINRARDKIEFVEDVVETRDMVADSQGRIWVTTKKHGIKIINPETMIATDFDPKSPIWKKNQGANTLLFDRKGKLWVGTMGDGVIAYDTITHQTKQYQFNPKNSRTVSSNIVCSLLEDKNGSLWVGTKNGGLCIYQPESDDFYRSIEYDKSGKYSVFTMQEDLLGRIWLGTYTGLVKFNPKDASIEKYTEEFGLQGDIFELHASCVTNSGQLLFGGQGGFNLFSPESIVKPDFTLTLVMNKLLLYDEEMGSRLKEDKQYTLDYNQNFLSFDFSLLDYISSKDSKYSFRMSGIDEEWSSYSHRNYMTYTELDPGKYIFEVRAKNKHGIDAMNQLKFEFIILPPFWQEWWFYILEVLFGGVITYLVYYIRIRAVKKQKRALEKIVIERTQAISLANENLQSSNEEIMQQNNEILYQRDALEDQYSIIQKLSRDAEVFNKLSQSITSSLDHASISAIVHSHLKEIWNLSVFGLGVANHNNNTLVFEYFYEYEEQLPSFAIPFSLNNDLFAWCIRTRESLHVELNEALLDSNLLPERLNTNLQHVPKSIILIPLIIGSKVDGLLVLMSDQLPAFSESDFNNIKTLGSNVAIALENANAYNNLEKQNENTLASIKYAKRIQLTILPSIEYISNFFDSFLFFKPKDIVSGDFYWFVQAESAGHKYTFAAVVDCTGHGVPGAFMSLIGARVLTEIVLRSRILSPDDILEELHERVSIALRQDRAGATDGMDVCLCRIEENHSEVDRKYDVVFCGAKRPLYVWNAELRELVVVKGTRRSINTKQRKDKVISFVNNYLELKQADALYLTSDGYADQPNEGRHPLGSHRLLGLIHENAGSSMHIQKTRIGEFLDNYKGGTPQRDDITIMALSMN